jgi:hypothetical protein
MVKRKEKPKRRKVERAKAAPRASAPPSPPPLPASELITQAEYARRRRVSRVAVNRAVREGRISIRPDGLLDPAVADVEWARNTTPRPVPGAAAEVEVGSRGVVITLNEAKTKHEYAKAQLAELELGERARELVRVDEVHSAIFKATRTARDLMESIPDRLAETLVGQMDPEVIRRMLSQELRNVADAMTELRFEDEDEMPAAEGARA